MLGDGTLSDQTRDSKATAQFGVYTLRAVPQLQHLVVFFALPTSLFFFFFPRRRQHGHIQLGADRARFRTFFFRSPAGIQLYRGPGSQTRCNPEPSLPQFEQSGCRGTASPPGCSLLLLLLLLGIRKTERGKQVKGRARSGGSQATWERAATGAECSRQPADFRLTCPPKLHHMAE